MNILDKEPIIIVCAANNIYAIPLGVVIFSALANLESNRQVIFFIIDGGISKNNKNKLLEIIKSSNAEIRWLKPLDGIFDHLVVRGHIAKESYFRLLIPYLLSNQFSKVIYLDCDLIVQGDLSHLWDMDINNEYLLAVQDVGIPYISSTYGLMNYQELGIPADYKYFNSGVLVINLEKWRSDNISKKVIDYIEKNSEYIRWCDQDGLNAVLAGKWSELETKWNQTCRFHQYSKRETSFTKEKREREPNDTCIIHFATSLKPWNSNEYHPANELFFNYLDLTPWSGWRFTIWRRIWKKFVNQAQGLKKIKLYFQAAT
jgi:lipopolysaccharide biosynthesis glycosyltransferase